MTKTIKKKWKKIGIQWHYILIQYLFIKLIHKLFIQKNRVIIYGLLYFSLAIFYQLLKITLKMYYYALVLFYGLLYNLLILFYLLSLVKQGLFPIPILLFYLRNSG